VTSPPWLPMPYGSGKNPAEAARASDVQSQTAPPGPLWLYLQTVKNILHYFLTWRRFYLLLCFYAAFGYSILMLAFTLHHTPHLMSDYRNSDPRLHHFWTHHPLPTLQRMLDGVEPPYPLGFHLLANLLAQVFFRHAPSPEEAALTLDILTPFLSFLFYPWCFLLLAEEFYRGRGYPWHMPLAAGVVLASMTTGHIMAALILTLPQLVGLMLTFLGVRALIRLPPGAGLWPWRKPLLYLIALPLFHTPMAVYYGLLVLAWLWIHGPRRMVAVAAVGLALALLSPLGSRAAGILYHVLTDPGQLWMVFHFLPGNLLMLLTLQGVVLGLLGLRAWWRRGLSDPERLITAAIVIPALLFWTDYNARPLLAAGAFLALPGGEALTALARRHPRLAVFLVWASVMFYGLLMLSRAAVLWGWVALPGGPPVG